MIKKCYNCIDSLKIVSAINSRDEYELEAPRPLYADKFRNFTSYKEIFRHISNAGEISADDAYSAAIKAIHKLTESTKSLETNDYSKEQRILATLRHFVQENCCALDPAKPIERG